MSLNNEAYCRTDTDHGAYGKYKIVYRENKIQSSYAICSDGLGNKKCISKNVYRHSNHAEHILRNVFCKFF